MLLHVDERIKFLAHLVGDAFATATANRLTVVPGIASQVDHLAAEGVPLLLQADESAQTVYLLRVVLDQLLQVLERRQHLRLGQLVGGKKLFIPGDQEPAHTGFHINRKLYRLVGVVDHPVGMLQPLDGR
ncbi:hypothetical protein D3C77_643650 [compost metagenome]